MFIWTAAWASQVAYRPISMKDLIAQSDLIVRVAPAEPFITQIDANGLTYSEHHVIVREVLHGYAKPGESLSILPSTLPIQRAMQAAYEKNGSMRSPIYDRYEAAPDSVAGERVAFLSYQGDELAWTAIDAFEVESRRLLAQISKRKSGSWDTALEEAMGAVGISEHPAIPGRGANRVARVLLAKPDPCWLVIGEGFYTGRDNDAYAEASAHAASFKSQLIVRGIPESRVGSVGLPSDSPVGVRSGDSMLKLAQIEPGERFRGLEYCPPAMGD